MKRFVFIFIVKTGIQTVQGETAHAHLPMASAAPAFPSTKETTNYARLCRLIVDAGSQVLRATFDRIHPPATLCTVLSNLAVYTILQSLQRKRVVNPLQWSKLYPAASSSVSSKNFDITLLMVLLRNICGLSPPATGWDNLPLLADLTPEADIARIKFYRNTVYGHAGQASVDDVTFTTCWTDIRNTLVRLGGATYETAIDNLKDDCIDPHIEEHYKKLLKQWKVDEDSIKEKLDNVAEELSRNLDELKASVANLEGRTVPVKADPLDVEVCTAQLRSHYNTTMSQVRITPWDRNNTVDIEEVYTNLTWLRDVNRPKGTTKRELDDYTKIFKGHGRVTNPKRILVYGRPGIGKSTFSQKIAVDWANQKEESLKAFDVMLLIKLQNVCGIQEVPAILEASELFAADGSISSDSLYDYVRHHQERVLLVLDGYDEYSAEKSSLIREIWEGKQLRGCHVVITTRPMEGEELFKSSHVQYEIRGFVSKKQVNDFARRFLSEEEIEEFDRYLYNEKLWDLAEIPLLLLMLCLIWKNRYHKELPKSKLELHERFVETLLCHMTLKDPDSAAWDNRNILDDFTKEITAIGKLAFEALLKNSVYVSLKGVNFQSDSLTDRMIRSGLFQFSKLSSADPNKTLLFLHKSIQEFLAARYLMNEAESKEGRMAECFATINSFVKALKLKELLLFMCEWSVEHAEAVFKLLQSIGAKEHLTECCFTNTPSLDDLSLYQAIFRDFSLECLISCSVSARQVIYPLFLSAIGGVISVNSRNIRKVAAEHLLQSSLLPSYVFFEHGNFADFVSVVDDLDAVVLTCSALRIKASHFLQMYVVSELQTGHFFVKREREKAFLYFSRIYKTYSPGYFEMLRDLTSPLPESSSEKKKNVDELSNSQHNSSGLHFTEVMRNCFSLVKEVEVFVIWTSEQLTSIRNLLSAVASPQDVVVRHVQVENDVVFHINFTDNLGCLVLDNLNMAKKDADLVASSLHQAPNLYSLKLSESRLQGSVSYLAENLCHVPRLSYLTLSGVLMDEQECSSLALSLKYVPKLTVLDLSNNQLGHGITALAQQLKSVPHLLHLNLEKTGMGEEEAADLAPALRSVPKLRIIQLGGNPLGSGVRILVRDLSYLQDLKQVDLKDVIMTQREVDAVSAAQRGIFITSQHDLYGNRKAEHEWPTLADQR